MDKVHLIKASLENDIIDINNRMELIKYFYLLKKNHPEFVNIEFGDRQGCFTMVPAQSPEIHKIFDPRIRPWYIGAVSSKGEHWTEVYIFASSQKPGITASVPIYKDNVLQGVCGIDIDISTLSRFLQSIRIENKGYAYIIENRHGRVIAHPDLFQRTWDPMHIGLLITCLSDLKAAGKQFGATNFQGEYFYTAYTDYPENGWTVGVTLPMTDFLKNIQSIKNTTISLVILAMVLCSIFSYLFTLSTVNPLKALRKGIERISSGDLNYHVDPPGLDIADALAHSFNQMAASLRKSKEELKRTYIELAEKDKMAALGQMSAGIAHELKNPLGVILGSAQVVANKDRPISMREEAADFIIHEIERLNKTLKAFLVFSKPAPPCFSITDPIQLLEETLAATEAQLNDNGIEVQRDIHAEKGLCSVDKDQIRQVLWNIILNAAQAMPEGGRLSVSAGYQFIPIHDGNPRPSAISPNLACQLTIAISDSGKGMAPDQIDTIFDPFVSYRSDGIGLGLSICQSIVKKTDDDGRQNVDGIGLGLSIVHQILKLHRAKIEVSSNLNRGTTFTLKFPCVENHEE